MQKSESIVNLSKALTQAQAEFPSIKFDSVNPFLKNKYASLGAVIDGTRPVLAKNGLSISQLTYGEEGNAGVQTVLLHTSGEWISNSISMPIEQEKGKSSAQVAGSIISYLRRYSLASILGIYSDEDSDGNRPPQNPTPRPKVQTTQKPRTVSESQVKVDPEPVKGTDNMMTIEEAFATTNSRGVAYGEMNVSVLENIISALYKSLKENNLTSEEQAEQNQKLTAAKIVRQTKLEGSAE